MFNDNPLEYCEKNAQWITVTDAVHPDDLVKCRRSDIDALQADNVSLAVQVLKAGNLLDVIYRDGGEHQAVHGYDKAIEDAKYVVDQWDTEMRDMSKYVEKYQRALDEIIKSDHSKDQTLANIAYRARGANPPYNPDDDKHFTDETNDRDCGDK